MIPAYCITLKETPKRRSGAEAEFLAQNLNVIMVQGIHGKSWGLSTVLPYNRDREPEDGDYFISAGHVGLCLSHWMIWNHMKISGVKEALIFEDDVILCPDFNKEFSKSYDALPQDWDLVYVGHCCGEGRPHTVINDRVQEIIYPMCTHALLVRDRALSVMLDQGATSYAPIDINLFLGVLPKLRVYCFVPQLASQHTLIGDWERSVK